MKRSTSFEGRRTRLPSRQLVPAIAAIGGACGLAAVPAAALELGAIQVESALGQPLRASISYALGPNEALYDFCIYLRPGPPGEGIPSVARARISLTKSTIVISGNVALKDPLLNVRLAVDCPYSPHLQRDYTLMLNPGEVVTAPPQPVYVETRPLMPVAADVMAEQPASTPTSRPAVDNPPIAAGSMYRVRVGDTASAIASRITDRGVELWPAVFGIVDANPDAFVDRDVNQLIAGSLLTIPDFSAEPAASEIIQPAVTESAEAPVEPVGEFEPAPVADVSRTPAEASAGPINDSVAIPVFDVASEPAAPVAEESSPLTGDEASVEESGGLGLTITATEELRPGDVIVPPAGQTAAPASVEVLPIEEADIPRVSGSTSPAASGTRSWLIWLAGAGLAIVLALLMFGARLRGRLSTAGSAATRKPTDDLDDQPPAREMALDADFDDGTGLGDSAEIDVMQDFGFAAAAQSTNELDLEITEDFAREPEAQPTDIIPPTHRTDESSILDGEVPPGKLTGGYDMSMIIDATKQPLGSYDRTAQDLRAVRVDDEEYRVEDQTLEDEVSLRVLEQDYEDELSATQALNLEIESAARELANRMDDGDLAETLEQPMAEDAVEDTAAGDPLHDGAAETTAIDQSGTGKTVAMPPVSDADLTAELTANLPTNIEADNDPSAADAGSGETVEMAAAGSDVTVEMTVETGKVDTGKSRKKRRK